MSDTLTLQPNRPGRWWAALLWQGLLSALMLCAGLSILARVLGSRAPGALLPGALAGLAWVLCAGADRCRRLWARLALRLLPWPVLLAILGPDALRRGAQLWVNCVISRWNQLHAASLSLLSANATQASITAVSAAAAFALGELAYWVVSRRRLGVLGVLVWLALLIPLCLDWSLPWACGLLLAGLLGCWMSGPQNLPTRQAIRFWAVCTLLLSLCAGTLPREKLAAVTKLREDTLETVFILRYGPDLLPGGDLSQAARLNQGDEPLLSLGTEQEKALYLRGYVGANYRDGVWTLPSSMEYGGEYHGLLAWLKSQGFDPLTQSAQYYALCDPADAPEANTLTVQNTGGSRYYVYAPASARSVLLSATNQAPGEVKDQRFSGSRLLGARSYTVEEVSAPRPAELTVRADWVSQPQTEAQERYVRAEAQYRNFVYDRYTTPDADLLPLLDQVFWTDYHPQHDSIYSALAQIRTVLQRTVTFDRDPDPAPEGIDPIRDLLVGSRRGNAVLYASAAVQALRSRGIPARYVEGYYLSAADSAPGAVTLSGQNAHAWAEVYFDGVGWLPVDVTPGYYFDAVTLQQMVALPDTVRKTAALEEDTDPEGSELTRDTGPMGNLPEPVAQVVRTTLLVLGLAALAALVCAALFALAELLRLLLLRRTRRSFRNASPIRRALLLQHWIFRALALWGVDACLGWQSEQTDAQLAQRFPAIQPGEFCRAVTLLEKVRYGGIPPEPYELRTLQDLTHRLYHAALPVVQPMYWRLRYGWLF